MLIPALRQGLRSDAGGEPAEGEARRADRAAARVGLPLVGRRRCRRRSPCSGARSSGSASAPTRARPASSVDEYMATKATPQQRLEALAAASDKLAADFGNVEDAVGRHQPLPAPHRRHRPAVQRRGAEHSGRLHLGALGLARLVRRAHLHGHEEDGTARAATASSPSSSSATRCAAQGGHRRRRERRSDSRRTSTIRRSATRPATCARCTSIAAQLKGHTERAVPPGTVIGELVNWCVRR